MVQANVHVLQVGSGQNLSYVIWSKGEAMAIDPSYAAREILQFIREKGLKLIRIVNTHGHSDHTEGNQWLREKTGAEVAVHEEDARYLPDPPDLLLHDGDVLNVGEVEVKVIHTPGHTPGGICLLSGDTLFTGDTLFVGNCGRTDLPGGSDEDLFDSLGKLSELDDDVKVCPGHAYWGSVSTIGTEKRTNPAMASRSLDEFRLVP